MQDISKAFVINASVHLIPNSPVIMGDIADILLVYFGAFGDRSMNVLVHLIPKSLVIIVDFAIIVLVYLGAFGDWTCNGSLRYSLN